MGLIISELTFHKNNHRVASVDELNALADSVEELPELLRARPILIDKDTMTVLAGEKKILALLERGKSELEDWQYRLISGLSEDEKIRLLAKDNTHSGRFDVDKLAEFSDDFEEGFHKNKKILDQYFLGNSKQIGSIKGMDMVDDLDKLFPKAPDLSNSEKQDKKNHHYVRVPVPKQEYGELKQKVLELLVLKVDVGSLLFSKLEEFLKESE